ncbi:hypothetical protein [Mycolicibacterium fallax]|uniref:hypothetical protein n=1 Tax=Mycolicibacterium fallax TaxID=1793 RepID=UPI00138C83B6|nr:hypothetical protein [Mycolicibacterium fallax]BBY98327.1 hypothetical protein MFAL_17940 [Mycolicibacterium fallax]HOW94912.1 hypothetical protein [Mycolicibacterium fallax]
MRRLILLTVATAVTLAGCGSEQADSSPSTVTVRETVTSVAAAPTEDTEAPTSVVVPTSAPTRSWTMPDLTGRNLQAAQDAIQALTNDEVFFTSSTDLTGRGRNQVLDRNWQVCTSTPAPGATFTKDTAINFGVVRVDTERCP